jgi:hypothetical protein
VPLRLNNTVLQNARTWKQVRDRGVSLTVYDVPLHAAEAAMIANCLKQNLASTIKLSGHEVLQDPQA